MVGLPVLKSETLISTFYTLYCYSSVENTCICIREEHDVMDTITQHSKLKQYTFSVKAAYVRDTMLCLFRSPRTSYVPEIKYEPKLWGNKLQQNLTST